MKKCPYCGKAYPDDFIDCPNDRTPLAAAISESVPPGNPATGKAGTVGRLMAFIILILAVLVMHFVIPFTYGFLGLPVHFFFLYILIMLLASLIAGIIVIALLGKISWLARIAIGLTVWAVLFGLLLGSPYPIDFSFSGFKANFLLTKHPDQIQEWAVGVLEAYEKGTLETFTNAEDWVVAPQKLYDQDIPPFIENLWQREPSVGIASVPSTGAGPDLSGSNSMNFTAWKYISRQRTHCVVFSWPNTGILIGRPDFHPVWEVARLWEIRPGIYLYVYQFN